MDWNNQQYANNLGKKTLVTQATFVEDHYQPLGAKGNFAQVFDSPTDPNDSQLRIYNIMTWLGGYTLPDAETPDRMLALLGKLNYGIGNASFEVDFDWKLGTQLSVAASFVRVSVAFAEVNAGSPDQVSVAAMLSSGSRASRSQVTRTYPQLTLASSGGEAGNVVLFPIPPLAHALNLFAVQPEFYDDGAVTIRYVGGASAGFSAASTDLCSWSSDGAPFLQALATEDGVRFPEAAKFVEITNNSETDIVQVTPCFTLSL